MENFSTTMERNQGGGSSFPPFSLDDDDLLFLDSTNLPSIDSIASDFSAFLDAAGPNGSLLPADEWSGTTNTLPDTPSSHQQLQHGLEGSSPLQSQIQAVQNKQQPPQQFVFESHTQTTSEVVNPQQSSAIGEQVDPLQAQARPGMQTNLHIETQKVGFPSRQVLTINQQSLPRDIVLNSPNFQPGTAPQQPDTAPMDTTFGGQTPRSLENRHMTGFQGQVENPQADFRMSFPRGLMVNGHFGMNGANPQQVQGMNHMQTSDGDGAMQSQLQSNFSNQIQSPQYMSKPNPRPSILPGHGLNNIPSFQLQSPSHQLQAKLHSQMMNHQGLLQQRPVQLGAQPSVFSSSQQPQYQLLQSQGYQMPGNHLPISRQMFPGLQPRMTNPLLQNLRLGALGTRQLGQQIVGQQIPTGAPEMAARYPPPGTNAAKCGQLFMMYIQEQRKRPADNNIDFWRDFVRKYFAPKATKRWCLTSYSATPVGRHAQGLFPMDYWYCNLCGIQPGRGFESSTDVLPRLFKIKYDSGLLDELLFLDVATEKYSLPSGKIVLEYSRAVHESVFSELRVIRHGKLRVTFNNALKICSWEFCTKAHEEVVPRKNLLQQVHQLASLVIESDQENFDKSPENLKSHCNAFTKAAKQLAVHLDAPMVNDLGFSKRYVRCLQIAEVVNSMKDLISFERKTGLGPIESLAKFPTLKKLQMEGGMTGLPPSVSLTQMINELTQGPSSIQSSTVTRLQSESMSEAQEQQNPNQAQSSSVFKSMDSVGPPPQQRAPMDARLQQLLHAEAYGTAQAGQLGQAGQVPSHQLTTQALPQQVLASQGMNTMNTNNQQSYQQVVLKPGTAKSTLSQPQSVNQTSLPGTPQSEMSDMRSNT